MPWPLAYESHDSQYIIVQAVLFFAVHVNFAFYVQADVDLVVKPSFSLPLSACCENEYDYCNNVIGSVNLINLTNEGMTIPPMSYHMEEYEL